jgi:hypothetical protein
MKWGWLGKAGVLFAKIVINAGREKLDAIIDEKIGPKKPARPAGRKTAKR